MCVGAPRSVPEIPLQNVVGSTLLTRDVRFMHDELSLRSAVHPLITLYVFLMLVMLSASHGLAVTSVSAHSFERIEYVVRGRIGFARSHPR